MKEELYTKVKDKPVGKKEDILDEQNVRRKRENVR
jgi:hypothetical protein